MSLIIPPGFVNAAFVFTGNVGTQPYVTTLGINSSPYGGDFVTLANDLMLAYAGALGSGTNNALTLNQVVLAVGSDGPSGSVSSDIAPIAMTSTSDSGPTSMSVIARKNTNSIGRRARGRMFLPGVNAEGGVEENGALTSTYTTAVNGLLDDFYDTLGPGGGMTFDVEPVLFHSQAPATPSPITSLTVAPLVGWVRGRIR